jgi:hypothetical protein
MLRIWARPTLAFAATAFLMLVLGLLIDSALVLYHYYDPESFTLWNILATVLEALVVGLIYATFLSASFACGQWSAGRTPSTRAAALSAALLLCVPYIGVKHAAVLVGLLLALAFSTPVVAPVSNVRQHRSSFPRLALVATPGAVALIVLLFSGTQPLAFCLLMNHGYVRAVESEIALIEQFRRTAGRLPNPDSIQDISAMGYATPDRPVFRIVDESYEIFSPSGFDGPWVRYVGAEAKWECGFW